MGRSSLGLRKRGETLAAACVSEVSVGAMRMGLARGWTRRTSEGGQSSAVTKFWGGFEGGPVCVACIFSRVGDGDWELGEETVPMTGE